MERKVLLPILPFTQGKARVIAANMAAVRQRRTGTRTGNRTGMAPTKVLKKQILRETHAAAQPSLTSVVEVERIRAILDDAKAHDVTVIPLAGQASFADYLVIATGTSTRHVSSMGRILQEKVGKAHIFGLEGLDDGEWVCADLGGIVVHIFVPEKRALYNLEKLWSHVFTPATDPASDYDETDNT